eukprot:7176126-Pyramimonas_sp.AAC.1
MAKQLRQWSPSISESGPGSSELLATFISWLGACAASLAQERFVAWSWKARSHRGGGRLKLDGDTIAGSYQPIFLLHCLVFAFHLRNVADGGRVNPLRRIMARAMSCFPPEIAGSFDDILSGSVWPSPSTVSRAR